ncbi:hypothetical protein EJ02DRAFT_452416 [Clathrospora elynae]|uniref:Uncharacterized protein n=1 Tax=Clathrospora elynae TaxID=706981 RepID=A0A6A5SYT9_9PLEO|nr:hypothetical protein EJ02DRAFT_452416 [Clathrospora elynae]
MDPFRNSALQDAKLQSLLPPSTNRLESQTSAENMPAPPAYHMVVDPKLPIPNMRSPYDAEERKEEDEEKDEDDSPEITINAATQVRGHGNIISIAQMDSVRIANLINSMLNGDKAAHVACPPSPQSPHTATRAEETSRTEVRGVKKFANINITVNCGATVIGDRNIVGPGLGDIARQMQMAQRNQAALHAQQQAQQAAAGQGQPQKVPSPTQGRNTLSQAQATTAQHHGVPYPAQAPMLPMSRSPSLGSETYAGVKRKAEGDIGKGIAKKQC